MDAPLIRPRPFKIMMSREDKFKAEKMINDLRRNPPRLTKSDWAAGKKALQDHKDHEARKDEDIKREIGDLSKDLSGFVYNQINGIGALFHGIGEGKKVLCSICLKHESTMHNMNDGKWYCSEHRWFGDLNEEQKEKERKCLLTRRRKG